MDTKAYSLEEIDRLCTAALHNNTILHCGRCGAACSRKHRAALEYNQIAAHLLNPQQGGRFFNRHGSRYQQRAQEMGKCPNCGAGYTLLLLPGRFPPGERWPRMEVPRQTVGDFAYCSDNQCPCGQPGAKIPKGSGYLYISPEVVEFRRDCPAVADAEKRIVERLGNVVLINANVTPVLVCERGAERRGLELAVAAEDARRWWKTGEAPLRPTPLQQRARKARPTDG